MMQNSNRSAIKVLIVDDHPVVLSGCRSLFASDNSVKIDEATDAKSGHRAYVAKRPDVTVIDIKLPDVSGFELMRRIRKDDPDARIIMFSMNDDPAFVVRAVELIVQTRVQATCHGHVSLNKRIAAAAVKLDRRSGGSRQRDELGYVASV